MQRPLLLTLPSSEMTWLAGRSLKSYDSDLTVSDSLCFQGDILLLISMSPLGPHDFHSFQDNKAPHMSSALGYSMGQRFLLRMGLN